MPTLKRGEATVYKLWRNASKPRVVVGPTTFPVGRSTWSVEDFATLSSSMNSVSFSPDYLVDERGIVKIGNRSMTITKERTRTKDPLVVEADAEMMFSIRGTQGSDSDRQIREILSAQIEQRVLDRLGDLLSTDLWSEIKREIALHDFKEIREKKDEIENRIFQAIKHQVGGKPEVGSRSLGIEALDLSLSIEAVEEELNPDMPGDFMSIAEMSSMVELVRKYHLNETEWARFSYLYDRWIALKKTQSLADGTSTIITTPQSAAGLNGDLSELMKLFDWWRRQDHDGPVVPKLTDGVDNDNDNDNSDGNDDGDNDDTPDKDGTNGG